MKKKKLMSVLLAGAMVLSMAACGDSGTPKETKTEKVEQNKDEKEKTKTENKSGVKYILESSDKDAKSKDNDMVIAIEGSPSSLDPANIPDTSAISVTRGMYETLVSFDKENKLVGLLAEKWEVSEDGLTYTFHLRDGVKFHDGTDFNADAVKANYERVCEKDNKLRQRRTFIVTGKDGAEKKRVESIETPDDKTVIFKLTESWSPFINRLSQFCMISPKALKEHGNDIMFHPCGTGPYKFESWVEGDYTKMVKNEEYWGKVPTVDSVTIKTVPEAGARTAMLQTGEADFVYPMAADQVKAVENTTDVNVIASESNIMRYVTLNTDLPELKNVKVRQAINHAINRDAYIKVMYDGNALPATSLVPSIIQDYKKQPAFDYDLKKAKKLLKEAGYEDGFELTLWGDNSTQEIKGMTFVKQQLEQIGIKVDVQPMDPATVSDKIYVDKKDAKINMWYVNWSASDYTCDGSMRALLYSTMCPPVSANTAYYDNKEFDECMDKGLHSGDRKVQEEAYGKAQDIAWKDCPWIYLANDEVIYSTKNYLEGCYVAPDGSFHYDEAKLVR